MTQRTPTIWKSNPAKSAGVAYSDPATAYNSPTTAFSSSASGLDEFNKVAEAWTPVAKMPVAWKPNAPGYVNLYNYDSATKVYDSATDTYDGVVAGQEFANQNSPTAWSPL